MIHDTTRDNNKLDLVITTNRNLINFCEVGEKFSNSDCNIIRYIINFYPVLKEIDMMIPIFRLANFNRLSRDVSKC